MTFHTYCSRGSCLSALLGGVLIALLAGQAQAAGDNDPVGDLPKSEEGLATQEATDAAGAPETIEEPGLAEGGSVGAGENRAAALRLRLGDLDKVTSPVGDETVNATLDPSADASLLLPADAVAAEGFLVLDQAAQADLGALLSGATQVTAVARTGLVLEFQLDRFARLAAEHLPSGWSATWVVHSVDSLGASHLAAARVSADGHLTEVVID